MKLCFLNFWGDFDPERNFFTLLLKKYREGVDIVSPEKADTIIYTCFGREHLKYNNCKKIFYTGENIRPNFNECDGSLTFDLDTYEGKNVRLPLWMLYIDWFNVGSYGNPCGLVPLEKIDINKFSLKPRSKFCSIVVNHLNNKRAEIIESLEKYKSVEGKGKPFGNWDYGEDKKYDFNSQYKFTICFENTIYPGYHTEKLFHAKVAGCIPIYFGAKTACVDFNPNCFLNLIDYNSIEEFAEVIKQIDMDNNLYEKYRKEPLFSSVLNLDNIYNKISTIL